VGCGVWGVGFYRFSGGQLPNFQGKSAKKLIYGVKVRQNWQSMPRKDIDRMLVTGAAIAIASMSEIKS